MPQLDVLFQLMVLILSPLQSRNIRCQRHNHSLLLLRLLLGSCDSVRFFLYLFFQLGYLVALVVGLPDGHFDILASFPDSVDLVAALIDVGLLVLVRSDERLVDGLVLVAELFEVVDVDNRVYELGEVSLDVVEGVLVELHGVDLPELGLFVFL